MKKLFGVWEFAHPIKVQLQHKLNDVNLIPRTNVKKLGEVSLSSQPQSSYEEKVDTGYSGRSSRTRESG